MTVQQTYIHLEGRSARFSPIVIFLIQILTFGVYSVIRKHYLFIKLFIETRKTSLKNSSMVLVTNEHGYQQLVKIMKLHINFQTHSLKRFVRNKDLYYFDAMYYRFFYDFVAKRYVISTFDNEKSLKENGFLKTHEVDEFVKKNPKFVKEIIKLEKKRQHSLSVSLKKENNLTYNDSESSCHRSRRNISSDLTNRKTINQSKNTSQDDNIICKKQNSSSLLFSDPIFKTKEKNSRLNEDIKGKSISSVDLQTPDPSFNATDFISNLHTLESYILFGLNSIYATHESQIQIILRLVMDPILLYTFFGVFVWACIDYLLYASLVSLLALFSLASDFLMENSKNNSLKSLSQKPRYNLVFKNGTWKKVDTLFIFPGDRIAISPMSDFVADCKIESGEVIVDEGFLTGETVPIVKNNDSCSHLVHAGTTVVRSSGQSIHNESKETRPDDRIKVKNIQKRVRFANESRKPYDSGKKKPFHQKNVSSSVVDGPIKDLRLSYRPKTEDFPPDFHPGVAYEAFPATSFNPNFPGEIPGTDPQHLEFNPNSNNEFLKTDPLSQKSAVNETVGDLFPEIPANLKRKIDQPLLSNLNVISTETAENHISMNSQDTIIEFAECSENRSQQEIHANPLLIPKSQNKRNTKIQAENSFAIGTVVATGFSTSKGSLVRNIMLPRPFKFIFYDETTRIMVLLFIIGIIFALPSSYFYFSHGFCKKKSIIFGTDLILCILSPALPATIKIGCTIAARRLKKQKIVCFDANRINLAGSATMAIFDKTGTLTSEGLDFICVDNIDKRFKSLESVPPRILEAISTCHNINLINEELAGDPLDVKMFQFSKAQLLETPERTILVRKFGHFDSEVKSVNSSRHSASCRVQNQIFEPNMNHIDESPPSYDGIEGKHVENYEDSPSYDFNVSEINVKMENQNFEDSNEDLKEGQQGRNSESLSSDEELICKRKFSETESIVFAKAENQSVTSDEHSKLKILKVFDFDNKLRRMSVICASLMDREGPFDCNSEYSIPKEGTNNSLKQNSRYHEPPSSINSGLPDQNSYNCFVKGSPEAIQKLLKETPEDYEEVVKDYALDGFRILALAYKKVDAFTSSDRNYFESDLTFLCFLVFANKLKTETKPTLNAIRKANIKIRMATGDNILTAISVARLSKMIDKYTPVIFPVLDESAKSVYDAQWLCLSDEDLTFDKIRLTLHKGEDRSSYNDFYVACEGREFDFFKKESAEYFSFILKKGVVFARMNPDQKKILVEDLNATGHCTIFCGDGANDCGALTAANVGLSLADNESSIASSFISTVKNISSVKVLIKEGRTALVNSYNQFLFIMTASIIQFTSLFLLSTQFHFLGDYQTAFTDFLIIMIIAQVMNTFQASRKLHHSNPEPKIFIFKVFFPISTILISTFLSFFLLIKIFCSKTDFTGEFAVCTQIGTSLFILSNWQIAVIGYVLSEGHPHRINRFKNKTYTFSSIFTTVLNIFITVLCYENFNIFGKLNLWLELETFSFKDLMILFGIVGFNTALVLAIYYMTYMVSSRRKK